MISYCVCCLLLANSERTTWKRKQQEKGPSTEIWSAGSILSSSMLYSLNKNIVCLCLSLVLPHDNQQAICRGIFCLRSSFRLLYMKFLKAYGNGDKNVLRTPCAWFLCALACALVYREQVGGLVWSFHPAIFNIWTAHYTGVFKPLVFEMFTEVFPSKTSKPNTGTDPWYLTSIQMGEGWAAGWVQEEEERDTRDLICDINLNAYMLRSANRFNIAKLSLLPHNASLQD